MSHNVASSRLVTGRTLADLIRGTFVLLVVLAVGLLIGRAVLVILSVKHTLLS